MSKFDLSHSYSVMIYKFRVKETRFSSVKAGKAVSHRMGPLWRVFKVLRGLALVNRANMAKVV